MISTINKATRDTIKAAIVIDYIFTNTVINTEFKTGIIKADIFDHFPIFFSTNFQMEVDSKEELQYLFKLIISGNSKEF